MLNEIRARELSEFVGLERRVCLKPENVMERETAQDEMLGALVELLDIDDAYVRPGSVVADSDCAMSAFSDSNEYISMLESIQHAQTGSYDDANIEDVDTVEPFKKF